MNDFIVLSAGFFWLLVFWFVLEVLSCKQITGKWPKGLYFETESEGE